MRANVHQGSSLYALDSDLLEALTPDLIITQELCEVCAVSYEIVAGAAKRLRGDPRVVSLEPASLDDVLSTIETVAQICGVPERATTVLDAFALTSYEAARDTQYSCRIRRRSCSSGPILR